MKKIMFNDKYGLTEAVLKGNKTMTRRLVPKSLLRQYEDYDAWCKEFATGDTAIERMYEKDFFKIRNMVSFKLFEKLAVSQQYSEIINNQYFRNQCLANEIDPDSMVYEAGWKNKMFVKSYFMPHSIEITGVKVERLQDISDEDCLREGITSTGLADRYYCYTFPHSPKNYHTPREAFAALIDKVSGKGTWDSNPFVFAYSFTLEK